MGNLDAEIKIELKIIDMCNPITLVQVEIPYLNKTVEVKVPNNIQEGHKIRLKGLGYADSFGERGDLYLVISKIKYNDCYEEKDEEIIMQKIVVVEYNDFSAVNHDLANGWRVKEFKPFKDSSYLYVYVLLEKAK